MTPKDIEEVIEVDEDEEVPQGAISVNDLPREELIRVIEHLSQQRETEKDDSPRNINPDANYLEITLLGIGSFKMNSPESTNEELFTNITTLIKELGLRPINTEKKDPIFTTEMV